MISVLALDFDGVILESVAVKDQAIYDLFEDASMEERQRVLSLHQKTPGINRRDRMTFLLTEGLGRAAPEEAVERLTARFAKLVWEGLMSCPEVPGARSFLESLVDFPCYVVSAAPQDELREVAIQRDFARYFVDLLGSPPAKAELLEKILQRENVPPESIIFIGDKISDLKAAETKGIQFIGRRIPANPTKFPEGVTVINDFSADAKYIQQFLVKNTK